MVESFSNDETNSYAHGSVDIFDLPLYSSDFLGMKQRNSLEEIVIFQT